MTISYRWPELCPRCGSRMHRSKALVVRLELNRLLKSLAIGCYPVRPPPAAVPETAPVTYGAVGKRSKPRPITPENFAPPDLETETPPHNPSRKASGEPLLHAAQHIISKRADQGAGEFQADAVDATVGPT